MGTKTLGRWIAELLSENKLGSSRIVPGREVMEKELRRGHALDSVCLPRRNTSSIHLLGLASLLRGEEFCPNGISFL